MTAGARSATVSPNAPIRCAPGAARRLRVGPAMMSVPFFGLFLALSATLAGRRGAAVPLWGLSIVTMLVLFRVHATDPLRIAL